MSLLFGKKGSKVKPQYTGLSTQTSTSAIPVPLYYGKNRGAPNIILQTDFASHKQKQGKGGGKGGTSYTYSGTYQLALCWGPIHDVTKVWKDQSKETSYAALGFSLMVGTNPQAAWGYLVTAHPDMALGYPDIALLSVANYDLGNSNALPQHSFEIEALLWNTGVGGTVEDADPALVLEDFLGNDTHGVGFNTAILDNVLSTADAPTTGDGAYQTYCQAMGFAISPFMSSQEASGEIILRWATLCNTAIVWTGYNLKYHPWGSDEKTANGVTYLPNFPVRYTLTDDDFIFEPGSDPITFNRSDPADVYNTFNIIIANKNNEYNDLPVPWLDQGLVDQYGAKNADSMDAKEITDPDMAAIMVTFMGQRDAYIRNEFHFTLPSQFFLLEPMDVLICQNSRLGTFAVIIKEFNETDDDTYEIVASEYPASISVNSTTSAEPVANNPVNTNADPGPVNPPILFEPPSSLASSPQVWAAVSGGDGTTANPNWGGAFVWISTDDVTYNQIGEVDIPARMGILTSTLATYIGANPDTAHTLQVDLTMSGGELESATSPSDAAAGVTLSYVDGELLSYETVTLTGPTAYDLDNLYRALYGSTVGAHLSGTDFARLDDAIFKYTLSADYIGQLLYLKFQSFNIFGGGVEDLSSCTAYTYTPTGLGYGTGVAGIPAVPTGLAGSAGGTFAKLTWNQNSINDNVTGYQVWRATGASQPFGSSVLIGTTTSAASEYTDSAVAGGQAYTYFLVAVNDIGVSSNTSGINLTPSISTSGILRLYGSLDGLPDAGMELFDIEMKGDEAFASGFPGNLGGCDVAPTSAAVFLVKKNGTNVGSMNIAIGATAATWTLASGLTFASGDRFSFYAPVVQDATLSGPRWTFSGTRS